MSFDVMACVDSTSSVNDIGECSLEFERIVLPDVPRAIPNLFLDPTRMRPRELGSVARRPEQETTEIGYKKDR